MKTPTFIITLARRLGFVPAAELDGARLYVETLSTNLRRAEAQLNEAVKIADHARQVANLAEAENNRTRRRVADLAHPHAPPIQQVMRINLEDLWRPAVSTYLSPVSDECCVTLSLIPQRMALNVAMQPEMAQGIASQAPFFARTWARQFADQMEPWIENALRGLRPPR